MFGALLSILIVTDAELLRPTLFVVMHVRTVPAVSAVSVTGPQPDEDVMADSASVTLQLTVTGLVYHPFVPCVPVMVGVITGGVVSVVAPIRNTYAAPASAPAGVSSPGAPMMTVSPVIAVGPLTGSFASSSPDRASASEGVGRTAVADKSSVAAQTRRAAEVYTLVCGNGSEVDLIGPASAAAHDNTGDAERDALEGRSR